MRVCRFSIGWFLCAFDYSYAKVANGNEHRICDQSKKKKKLKEKNSTKKGIKMAYASAKLSDQFNQTFYPTFFSFLFHFVSFHCVGIPARRNCSFCVSQPISKFHTTDKRCADTEIDDNILYSWNFCWFLFAVAAKTLANNFEFVTKVILL